MNIVGYLGQITGPEMINVKWGSRKMVLLYFAMDVGESLLLISEYTPLKCANNQISNVIIFRGYFCTDLRILLWNEFVSKRIVRRYVYLTRRGKALRARAKVIRSFCKYIITVIFCTLRSLVRIFAAMIVGLWDVPESIYELYRKRTLCLLETCDNMNEQKKSKE